MKKHKPWQLMLTFFPPCYIQYVQFNSIASVTYCITLTQDRKTYKEKSIKRFDNAYADNLHFKRKLEGKKSFNTIADEKTVVQKVIKEHALSPKKFSTKRKNLNKGVIAFNRRRNPI